METSAFRAATMSSIQPAKKRSLNFGFSILEVLIAITVLAVGLCAMAALVAQTLGGTERARYMALATTLASEKLEDLSRYPAVTPAVGQIQGGGSLTSDSTNTGNYNCFDDVDLSNTNGQIGESYQTSTGYSTIVHQATGEVDVNPSNTAPVPGGSGNMAFHRRWLIEQDPVVNGVTLTGSRRITVLVTLSNLSVRPAVNFQMSTVRP
jgi:prepilin-type N-terminal cleavage/methylation domain-containing protein